MEIEFRYKPQGEILRQFHRSTCSRKFIMGPLGSAKTSSCCTEIWRISKEQVPDGQGIRRTRWAAIRNTYSDLKTTTIPSWREIFDDAWGAFTMGPPPVHRVSVGLPDGTSVECEVWFIALDRPEHIKKLRGLQLTGALLNEVKELPKGVLDMLDLRVGRFPPKRDGGPSWYGLIGDTNAPDDDHWYYKMAEETHPEDWLFLRQPGGVIKVDGVWKPNPEAENLQNLPDNYYLRGMAGKSEDWIKVNLANEYGTVFDGMPVYPEYVDSIHCKDVEPIENIPIDIGIDFGLTPAAIFGQRLPNGRIIWFDELATENMGTTRFAEELKGKLGRDWPRLKVGRITGDPAGNERAQTDETTPFMILRANDLPAHAASTNDPDIRRDAVANPLSRLIDGAPGLTVHSRCKITRKGMAGGYCYRRVQVAGDARYHNKVDKNRFSHPCDAGQYLMLGLGEGHKVISTNNPAFRQGTIVVSSNFDVL